MQWTDAAALGSPFLSGAVALFAVYVATRQSKTAADRLRVDMFDRRFAAWEECNAAINGRLNYLSSSGMDGLMSGESSPDTFVAAMSQARLKARFLFGREVRHQFDMIDMTIMSYLTARAATLNISDLAPEGRADAAEAPAKMYMEVIKTQNHLMYLVGRYLDLSNIAVGADRASGRGVPY